MENVTLPLGGTYKVREVFDADPDESGIEIFSIENEYIGKTNMFSTIPDWEDQEEYDAFLQEVSQIVFENE